MSREDNPFESFAMCLRGVAAWLDQAEEHLDQLAPDREWKMGDDVVQQDLCRLADRLDQIPQLDKTLMFLMHDERDLRLTAIVHKVERTPIEELAELEESWHLSGDSDE